MQTLADRLVLGLFISIARGTLHGCSNPPVIMVNSFQLSQRGSRIDVLANGSSAVVLNVLLQDDSTAVLLARPPRLCGLPCQCLPLRTVCTTTVLLPHL